MKNIVLLTGLMGILLSSCTNDESDVVENNTTSNEMQSTMSGGILNAAIGKNSKAKTNVGSIKNSDIGGSTEVETTVGQGGIVNIAIGEDSQSKVNVGGDAKVKTKLKGGVVNTAGGVVIN